MRLVLVHTLINDQPVETCDHKAAYQINRYAAIKLIKPREIGAFFIWRLASSLQTMSRVRDTQKSINESPVAIN